MLSVVSETFEFHYRWLTLLSLMEDIGKGIHGGAGAVHSMCHVHGSVDKHSYMDSGGASNR